MARERTQQQVVLAEWGWENVLPRPGASREQVGKALREKTGNPETESKPGGTEPEGSRL